MNNSCRHLEMLAEAPSSANPVRLDTLSLEDVSRCGGEIRELAGGAGSMEEAAQAVVRYFYRTFRTASGDPAFALARLFLTQPLGSLPPDLQETARAAAPDRRLREDDCGLVLLATAGLLPEWNDRRKSRRHQVIPLADEEMLQRAPMVAALVRTLGLRSEEVLGPDPNLLIDLERRTYNVFHVARARGSAVIPGQEFVRAHQIRSVLGFGAVLPSGALFACILFSRASVPRANAVFFRSLALNVKLVLLPFDPEPVFEDDG